MSCCNKFERVVFATAFVDGTCKRVLKVTTTDPVTAAVTVSYRDPSTNPPTPITGTIEPGPCTVGEEKAAKRDMELVTVCDPDGNSVLIQYDTTVIPIAVKSATVLTTGAPYTGAMSALVPCGGKTVEADPITMCDAGTVFLRYVVMEDGAPTGVTFDKTLSGVDYTVTDEAGLTVGNCPAATATPMLSSTDAASFVGPVDVTSFAVSKPACCVVTITTSIGTIEVQDKVQDYATQVYKEPFTVSAVAASGVGCGAADVKLTFNRS